MLTIFQVVTIAYFAKNEWCRGWKMLTSHHAAANIAEHIACQMRTELAMHIVNQGSKFSIMVDESTDVSQQQYMIVFVRAQFDDIPCNYFFDIVPVNSATAESLYESLISCLTHAGLSVDVLKKQMIGFCSDGASNMTRKS